MSGVLAKFLFQNFWLALLVSVFFYFMALAIIRQIKIAEYKNFRKILGK
jgi:hypothetical protein